MAGVSAFSKVEITGIDDSMTFRLQFENDFPENGSLELIFPWVSGQSMINSQVSAMAVVEGDMAFVTDVTSVTDNEQENTALVLSFPQFDYFTAGVEPDISVWDIQVELIEGLLFSGAIKDSDGATVESFEDEPFEIR